MQFLEQFITQTGKQPGEWTSQDIAQYLEYIETHMSEMTGRKDMLPDGLRENQ